MALSQSALSELLDAFRAGDGVDLIRESVRTVLQELIEVEATEVIGAGRYERTATRVTDRNGARPRLLTTKAGDVALSIPKLRGGSFFPSVLQPRRRIDQALYAFVMEAYGHGVSTRAVDDLMLAKKAWLTPGSPRTGELVRADERPDDVGAGNHADQPADPHHGQHPPRQPNEQPSDLLDRQLFRPGDRVAGHHVGDDMAVGV